MPVKIAPYLSFRDTAKEAMDHYQAVFGGTLDSQTFGEFGMVEDPADTDLVMHSQLDIDGTFVLMAGDTPHSMRTDEPTKKHHPVCLYGDDETTLRRWWDGLLQGGTVDMPLEQAPWGDHFGGCTDTFGISWMVNISAPQA